MHQADFVAHKPAPGAISLVDAPIIIDHEDFEGIRIAATTLAQDIARVTGEEAPTITSEQSPSPCVIIVGSVQRSKYIHQLALSGSIDINIVQTKWETWCTALVHTPWDGCANALVICGSDKRGTIFGIYALSEQIGVSPWYWWADVPVEKSLSLYALDVRTVQGPPSVKYRGIFINDEAPALSAWVHEKYGPKYNSEFYKHVFELLLRLKANFLWPAMWFGYPHPGNSFFMDDPLNQELADKYGIVVSTSHHEPMQRAMNEWFDVPYNEPEQSWNWTKNKEKIAKYFVEGAQRASTFESVITIGMRGDGDREMGVENPQEVLKEVLSTQRNIIGDVYGREDAVPQVMALYKEVQEYYENGLEIPEDPRSYKWLNSNSLAKVWHQLDQAHRHGADQIWIFNVGDIKPLEVPLSFVMSVGWDAHAMALGDLPTFLESFTSRTFGSDLAVPTAKLLIKYDKLIALRKHEHVEPKTFSLINYSEANKILSSWEALVNDAETLSTRLHTATRPSFFQLILHPIKASYTYMALQIYRTKNALYAKQRRNSANHFFNQSISLFKDDFRLSQEYHTMLNGKWNHIMRQPHLGYRETWHAPSRDMISGLCLVQASQESNPIVGNIGIAVEGTEGVRPGLCNEESDRTHPSRRDLVSGVTLPAMDPYGPKSRAFELYLRGPKRLTWQVESPVDWMPMNARGILDPTFEGQDPLIQVTVNWKLVPKDFNDEVLLVLRSDLGDYEHIHIPVKHRSILPRFVGHVEADQVISIPATDFANKDAICCWRHPYLGREASGAVSFRMQPNSGLQSCELLYPFYTFTSTTKASLHLYFTLTLDVNPTSPALYGLSLDGKDTEMHKLVQQSQKAGELPPGWLESVMDCVWIRKHQVDLGDAGAHTLKILLQDENMALEKIVVDLGGVRESYLGPPASFYATG
ncbi:glycoside hydrolase family 115 protein [Bipolaris sorokiniana ND90Pr]|uniref:Glycoside hydrolase family 115 protein n=1 Tax=Cochliobolus sativus (strain ND90Pr / ATCC 201652) TaxID=665912 RepID=M2RZ13_COCSN|nr:glycoside hydrolase family 115 protein [Bipolaris sorokiniana ND90Pr]EMD60268.1 glycoside hydrolase family 115 protein [Bipolaris sorokiniana ND90Pr]